MVTKGHVPAVIKNLGKVPQRQYYPVKTLCVRGGKVKSIIGSLSPLGAMVGQMIPPLVTAERGKPSLVQEQIFAKRILSSDRVDSKKNGRSLEPCSDVGSREMVIHLVNALRHGGTKLGL